MEKITKKSSKELDNNFNALHFLLGDKNHVSIEGRIHNGVSIMVLMLLSISIAWNIFMGMGMITYVSLGVFLVIYSIIYYYGINKNIHNYYIMISSIFLCLGILWFTADGIHGSTPIFILISSPVMIFLTKFKHHYKILLSILVLFIGSLIIQNIFPNFILPYPSDEARQSEIIFASIIGITVAVFFASYLKSNYDYEYQKLEQNKELLQEANATKDLFFSIIAHDLRSPFNGILGLSELLAKQSDMPKEKQRQLSQALYDSSSQTYQLLNNLLDWARLEQGVMKPENETFSFQAIMLELSSEFDTILQQKSINLHIKSSDDDQLFTDKNMLSLLLRNLISNAIKFSHKGGDIDIECKKSTQYCIIRVQDYGIGMDEEIQKHLFELNNAGNRVGTRGEKSIGLGLIISKKICKILDAELSISSQEKQGSRLEIKFKNQKKQTV